MSKKCPVEEGQYECDWHKQFDMSEEANRRLSAQLAERVLEVARLRRLLLTWVSVANGWPLESGDFDDRHELVTRSHEAARGGEESDAG